MPTHRVGRLLLIPGGVYFIAMLLSTGPEVDLDVVSILVCNTNSCILLKEDICHGPLVFGGGGKLVVGKRFYKQAGFGLVVNSERLSDAK